MKRPPRRGELGLFRGCCLGLMVLLAVVGFAAFIVDRATASPDLGTPAGPSHGGSEAQIAVALGQELQAELLSNAQGAVTLSEQDLTVIAREHNPHPDRLHDIEAVVRDGDVAVSAQTSEGPIGVTAVAYLSLTWQPGQQMISVQVVRLDLGQLTLPQWLRDRLLASVSPSLAVNQLFASPQLQPLRANIECVAVTSAGVTLGVHRPGVLPDPAVCAP